jgi:hypothetical protein
MKRHRPLPVKIVLCFARLIFLLIVIFNRKDHRMQGLISPDRRNSD